MTETSKKKKLTVPKPGVIDVAHNLGEVLSTCLPFAGPELFRMAFSSPLEARRDKFMQEVAEVLYELQNRDIISIAELVNNQEFVSLVIEAGRIALSQHEEEKLRYLRNALVNSIAQDLSYDIKITHLRSLGELTSRHILTLRHLHRELTNQKPGSIIRSWDTHLYQITNEYYDGSKELAAVFLDTLCRLAFIEKRPVMKGRMKLYDDCIFTDWGEQFLVFIESPS